MRKVLLFHVIISTICTISALNSCEICVQNGRIFYLTLNYSPKCLQTKEVMDFEIRTTHTTFESCKTALKLVKIKGNPSQKRTFFIPNVNPAPSTLPTSTTQRPTTSTTPKYIQKLFHITTPIQDLKSTKVFIQNTSTERVKASTISHASPTIYIQNSTPHAIHSPRNQPTTPTLLVYLSERTSMHTKEKIQAIRMSVNETRMHYPFIQNRTTALPLKRGTSTEILSTRIVQNAQSIFTSPSSSTTSTSRTSQSSPSSTSMDAVSSNTPTERVRELNTEMYSVTVNHTEQSSIKITTVKIMNETDRNSTFTSTIHNKKYEHENMTFNQFNEESTQHKVITAIATTTTRPPFSLSSLGLNLPSSSLSPLKDNEWSSTLSSLLTAKEPNSIFVSSPSSKSKEFNSASILSSSLETIIKEELLSTSISTSSTQSSSSSWKTTSKKKTPMTEIKSIKNSTSNSKHLRFPFRITSSPAPTLSSFWDYSTPKIPRRQWNAVPPAPSTSPPMDMTLNNLSHFYQCRAVIWSIILPSMNSTFNFMSNWIEETPLIMEYRFCNTREMYKNELRIIKDMEFPQVFKRAEKDICKLYKFGHLSGKRDIHRNFYISFLSRSPPVTHPQLFKCPYHSKIKNRMQRLEL